MDGMLLLCIILMERQIIKVSNTLHFVDADAVGSLSQRLCLDIAFFCTVGSRGFMLCFLRFSIHFFG